MHTRQTGGPPRSTNPTGQLEPRRLAVDRVDLAAGEPNGEAVGASVLGAPNHTDRCPDLAERLTGASSPARMAHSGATSPRPHLPVHGMAVRGALELQRHQAKLTRAKEGKEGDGNSPP
jgi:hypothetical protein